MRQIKQKRKRGEDMRSRIKIERDFNKAMGVRKEEFLEFQRQKLLMEAFLDIRECLKEFIKRLNLGELK